MCGTFFLPLATASLTARSSSGSSASCGGEGEEPGSSNRLPLAPPFAASTAFFTKAPLVASCPLLHPPLNPSILTRHRSRSPPPPPLQAQLVPLPVPLLLALALLLLVVVVLLVAGLGLLLLQAP